MNTPWISGLFLISGAAGFVGSFLAYVLLHLPTKQGMQGLKILATGDGIRDFLITGMLTGVVERAFFTLLIGLLGAAGIPAAAIGWITVKGQLHYQIFTKEGALSIEKVYVSILCSLVSLAFAVLGGYCWNHGFTFPELWAHIFHRG